MMSEEVYDLYDDESNKTNKTNKTNTQIDYVIHNDRMN